jgi:hypothetical protein
VLASNPVFDDLLPDDLRFDRDDPESLPRDSAGSTAAAAPILREIVAERHSVEHWADAVLATVAGA